MGAILFLVTVPITASAFLLPVMRMCRAAGVRVGVAAGDGDGWDVLADECDFRVVLPSVRRRLHPLPLLRFGRQLRQAVEMHGVSMIHMHTPTASAVGRMALAGTPLKIIYTAHGFHFVANGPRVRWLLHYPLERFLARFTDTLITLNDEDYRIAKRWTLRKGAPVVLCPGVGVSPRTAPQVALERSPIRVLMLAEFNTEKRHGDLVEAVGLLPRGLVHVLLAGAGPERDRVEAMVGARGLAEEVTFLGWVPNGSKLIGDADIVVLPSVREGLPRSILEAMSHGVPVIGTDTRGIRDLLSDGHGVLVPPRDPPALAAALKRLATSASTREAIGRKAWERSHQYSIERVLECHRKVYGRFLSATR